MEGITEVGPILLLDFFSIHLFMGYARLVSVGLARMGYARVGLTAWKTAILRLAQFNYSIHSILYYKYTPRIAVGIF